MKILLLQKRTPKLNNSMIFINLVTKSNNVFLLSEIKFIKWGVLSIIILTGISCSNSEKESTPKNIKHIEEVDAFHQNDTLMFQAYCDTPKYFRIFQHNYPYPAYFDYEQGMECAKKLKRPVLLMFDGWGVINARRMNETILSKPEFTTFANRYFVIICLYTDDRTRLPKQEWFKSSYGKNKVISTIGMKNIELQTSILRSGAQPAFTVLDNQGNQIAPTMGTTFDIEEFLYWLKSGKRAFDGL